MIFSQKFTCVFVGAFFFLVVGVLLAADIKSNNEVWSDEAGTSQFTDYMHEGHWSNRFEMTAGKYRADCIEPKETRLACFAVVAQVWRSLQQDVDLCTPAGVRGTDRFYEIAPYFAAYPNYLSRGAYDFIANALRTQYQC